jgi:phosphotriesterase-related protein
MWDPRNYSDSDYGLDDNESFEPEEIDERVIDITVDPHIMTVLGPIDPTDLGICQVDEHLLIDPPNSADDLRLDDPLRAIEELTSFVTAGGRAIVDATTPDRGRDLVGLLDVARRVPAHVICSSGGHDSVSSNQIVAEISGGVGLRKIRPGVVRASGGVGAFQAAAASAIQTGVPLHFESNARMATELLPAIESYDRVRTTLAIVFRGDLPSTELAGRFMSSGAFVALSGVGPTSAADTARLVVKLAEDGFADRLLVSQGTYRRSLLHAWGGQPGLVYLLERYTLELMEAGSEASLVRRLLIDNAAAALTINPRGRNPIPT